MLSDFLAEPGYVTPASVRGRNTERFDLCTADWLKRFGVITSEEQERGLLRIQTGKLAAFAFPCSDAERIQATSDLLAWLFIYDDFHADGAYRRDEEGLKRCHAQMQSVLDRDPRALLSDPFAASLSELYARIERLAPPDWLRRLSADIADFFAVARPKRGSVSRRLPHCCTSTWTTAI